jgi:hypothetical protein
VISGQRNRWWRPAQIRERQAALERQADEILKSNRRRQRRTNAPVRSAPPAPETVTKWIKLGDLKVALRKARQ